MSENTERRYLKWYNKIGYGSGDVAGNVVYAFLSSFVMIYLTDTVGLNPGIVGTLIAVSKAHLKTKKMTTISQAQDGFQGF